MKKILLIILGVLILTPFVVYAQESEAIFKARVSKILEEERTGQREGSEKVQQNIQLIGAEGDKLGKIFEFKGIGNFDLVTNVVYKEGDRVFLLESADANGELKYFITDFDRTGALVLLFVIFSMLLIMIGRLKGLRALISLVVSFLIIIKYIIPNILAGANPLLVTFFGSVLILIAMIYFTEGLTPVSHISIVSILVSLVISIFISWFFVELTHLAGVGGEDIASLLFVGEGFVNFKGLLLAGIIIGLIGVLDDVVIAQVVAVKELNSTDPNLSKKNLFKKAYNIGVSHISSMTNTLFLAYAGVSLPLLILFTSGSTAFQSTWQAINNEAITTEIIRTLTGSIGLILSVPIATLLATAWYKKQQD